MISGQQSVFRDNLRHLRDVILAVAIVLAVVVPTLNATTVLTFMALLVAAYLLIISLRR